MKLADRTDEQIAADIKQLQKALAIPTLPNDERQMHSLLLKKLQLEMGARMNAFQSEKQPATTIYVGGHTMRSNSETIVDAPPNATKYQAPPARTIQTPPSRTIQTPPSRTILAGGHSKTPDPITNKIEVAQDSNRFNPTITITWSDGYQLTVDETTAVSRFKSTFRDTCALKCVSEQRFAKMWRWDTPWRASGFFKGITILRDGLAPSLKDLGYTYPTKLQQEVFTLISQHCIDENQ